MKKHANALVLLLVVLTLILSACAPAAPAQPAAVEQAPAATQAEAPAAQPAATEPAKTDEVVKLTFWSRDSDQALVEGLIKLWNESHKNIQIEMTIIPAGEYITKFGAAVAGGTAPDLTAIDLIYGPQFASLDQLTDLTDLAKAMPNYDKLSPSHVRLGIYNGKNYTLPFSADASVLIWNKGLFKKAGLDPEKGPANYAEIYEAAKKVRALGSDTYGFYFSGGCAGCNTFTFTPLIWASGGDVLSADNTTPTLTDPKVKEALGFYQKMWSEDLIPAGSKTDTGTDFVGAFTTGKIGMVGSGGFMIGILKNQYPDIDFGVTYLPGQTGGQGSFAGGDSIAIPTGTKHLKEAFEFIQWLYTDEVQLEYFAKNNNLPVRTDLADNKYFQSDPRMIVAAKAMGLGRTPYSLKYNELFNDPNGPWNTLLQQAIFEGQIDEAVTAGQAGFSKVLSAQ